MAVVALILGLSPTMTPISNEDHSLIALVKGVFAREEKGGCKIAYQCRRMLDILSGIPLCDNETTSGKLPSKIVIPYFGYIHRDLSRQALVADLNEQGATVVSNMLSEGMGIPSTESGSNSLPEVINTEMCWEFGGLEHFQVDDLSSWLDTAMLDMDPEWDISCGGFSVDDAATGSSEW
jgi:hypothetical protein